MARLEGSGKSIDDVFRWFFETYEERQPLAPPSVLLQDYQKELLRLRRTKKYINQSLATLDVFFATVPAVSDVSRGKRSPLSSIQWVQPGHSAE
jgi:hypothetical protein